MRKVIIFGATSAIAQAVARRLAQKSDALFLVGRNPNKLAALVSDLVVRGAKPPGSASADLNDTSAHARLFQQAVDHLGGCDVVLIAHGDLGHEAAAQRDYTEALASYHSNFLSAVSLATVAGNYFEAQKSGCLVAISSVAGDRGRQSNYIYGSAKGALSLFLQGLRNRLFHSGVHVITVKPGFVDTPMTAQFKKGALWAQPDTIAAGIVRAVESKREVVYLPGFWWLIMFIFKVMPEGIFKRLRT